MSNSKLVSYTKLSPNKGTRRHKIDTVTIHCMAGNLSVETCGDMFAKKSVSASSNYGIGSDGRIALYVPEESRSWATSNVANDDRAVTIEVANDGGAPDWHVSDKAYSALIDLLVDICQRNGIAELKWKADKSLIGKPDKQNMTVHRWFANKACPGNYLYNLHGQIASEVNERLEDENMTQEKFNEMLEVALSEREKKKVSAWAKTDWEKATKAGIVDGTAPQGIMTREQYASSQMRK